MSMMDNFFGFKFLRSKTEESKSPAFAPELTDDGSFPIPAVGANYGTFLDIEGLTKGESELVKRYREISLYPEVDLAIQDIVNEAICEDEEGEIVKLDLEQVNMPDRIKDYILQEFDNVLDLLSFDESGSDIFFRWYVDGKIHYHVIFDPTNIKRGIMELRLIDAMKMKKVTEYESKLSTATQASIMFKKDEYFLYSDTGFFSVNQDKKAPMTNGIGQRQGVLKISSDSIIYCSSGIVDPESQNVLSHLHKAIRPANQLRMLEDGMVIYRMSRASERRVFKIPVGHLPRQKQEEYMNKMINAYRNKITYDMTTGTARDDKRFLSMQEDLWLPVYGDGKSTDITTLPGAQALDQIGDVNYFKQKLYLSLNIPVSRIEQDKNFTLGRTNEITRDELKFNKFISKLRRRFGRGLLLGALRTQLILKGIMTLEDWEDIEKDIGLVFSKDNNFVELKEMELLNDRLDVLAKIDEYVGTYFSRETVYKKVLNMTAEEMKEEIARIEKEKAYNSADYKPKPAGGGGGLGGMDLGGGGMGDIGGMEGGDLGEIPDVGGETPIPGEGAEPTAEVPEPDAEGNVTFSPPNK